ncbi:MAG: InlB B-repeat-containing protein [Acholeplasmatales bacterium]|nr:InlB B-repeat-containing protein [Acholeplasmatales bacterium]
MKKIALGIVFLLSLFALTACDQLTFEITKKDDSTTTISNKTYCNVKIYTFMYDDELEKPTIEENSTIKVQKGECLDEPDLKIDGYKVYTWLTSIVSPELYDFSKKVNDNFSLYAHLVKTYTVTFNTNGGEKFDSKTVFKGENIGFHFPKKTGYSFDGWYLDEELTEAFDINSLVTSDLTLYAKWNEIINTYNVTFESNGGTSVSSKKVNDGLKLEEPTKPTKEDYIFKGWFLDEKFTEEFDFDSPIKSDLKLYAKWEINNTIQTVNFVDQDSIIESQSIKYGDKAIEPDKPTRDKYVFKGWFEDQELTKEFDFNSKIKENKNIYAKWAKLCKVTFDADTVSYQYVEEGTKVEKPQDPKRDCYAFRGWRINSLSGAEYDFDTPITDDLVLKADFERTKCRVTYYYDKDNSISEYIKVRTSIYYTYMPDSLKKQGYELDGWYYDKALTKPYKYLTPIAEDITLYAKMTKTTNNGILCEYRQYRSNSSWDYLEFNVRFTNYTNSYVTKLTRIKIDVYVDDVLRASQEFTDITLNIENGSGYSKTFKFTNYDKSFWSTLTGEHKIRVKTESYYV